MDALLTLHDVMPETLPDVAHLISILPSPALDRLTLLVVPGLAWEPRHIARLEQWQQLGIRLAGHGWQHHCSHIKGPYHWLHSKVLSRQAAEHLQYSATSLPPLLENCFNWFSQHQLDAPDYYVPPAWALGALNRTVLQQSPFRYFENLDGIYDSLTDMAVSLPLAGFEADTRFRAVMLSIWNELNCKLCNSSHPLRIALHPGDHNFMLGHKLLPLLGKVKQFRHYKSLFMPVGFAQ